MRNIPYGKHHLSEDDIEAVVATLRSGWITEGPKVEEFERDLCRYNGAPFAAACFNGTAALHLGVMALSEGRKGKVLTTPMTFVASSNCALYSGLEVEFVDVDPDTGLMDLDLLESRIENNADAYQGIIPVTYGGHPLDLKRISKIANKYNLWIMEDACHSPGAFLIDDEGEKIVSGSCKYTDAAIFSFHPVKHLTTGEGGAIFCRDEKIYKKFKLLRSHGITKATEDFSNDASGEGWLSEMQCLGYNYRMTDIQAALGCSQLKRAEEGISKRNQISQRYNEAFANLDELKLPFLKGKGLHAYHLYVIQTNRRKELYNFLKENGIYSQVHYLPVYFHPYYRDLGFEKGLCPVAEMFYSGCLSLPMYPTISEESLDHVIKTVKLFFSKKT
jgi:UDP-4-amino-4,6-dideoxy-N-acetyl-beta-L-altrosamine transaminase